jgi:hypothetical protein
MKYNQRGFGAVEMLIMLVVISLIVGTGWYTWQKNTDSRDHAETQETTKDAKTRVPDTYSGSKATDIENYNLASDSLKTALVDVFYDPAKKDCDYQNDRLPASEKFKYVISVEKMVRDDFATIGLCASGATRLLAHVDNEWKQIAALDMAPTCTKVDQYKISKEVVPICVLKDDGSGNTRAVTYP